MPTYEYKCDACGHAFEKFHSMSADPIKTCPVCGKDQVRRLIGTGAGLIFKGSGFYITDYRDSGYKDKAKADAGATSKDAGKGDGSGGGDSSSGGPKESKPAAAGGSSDAPAAPAAKPAAQSESAAPSKSADSSSSSSAGDKK